ncbi:MAG: hypothetical protein ACI822_002464 [Gammaproteobacteria bacterium]|jgi:hypothetical protein
MLLAAKWTTTVNFQLMAAMARQFDLRALLVFNDPSTILW